MRTPTEALGLLLPLVLAFGGSGCAGSLAHLRPLDDGSRIACPGPKAAPPVEVTYLRTAGVLFRRGTDVVMTAPLYSNPPLLAVMSRRPIAPDADVIRRHLPWVEDAKAILVGHAHYDHLMDVPEIAWKYAPAAVVYGSKTAINLVTPLLPAARLRDVEDAAGTSETPGSWIPVPGTRVRFMPLVSEHAPHVFGVKAFSGSVDTPRVARTAWDWKEGQTLAYLIDFLADDGTIAYRVHYRDSASNEPCGKPPSLPPPDDRRVDLAVVCVASFDEVENYPTWAIEALQPRHVLLVHWESFFRSPDRSLAPVPLLNTKAFVAGIPVGTSWTTLKPGATMTCSDGARP